VVYEAGKETVLDQTLKECNNNLGMLKDNPNYVNVANARQQLWQHKSPY